MENAIALSLDTSILPHLQTYEDFLSYYIHLEETSSAFYWLKVDLLKEFAERHGEESLKALASDIKIPRATLGNYIRTAKAFPKEKRIPNASFTLHFQAAFVDSYDTKNGEFTTNNRFAWLEKAVDNNWSTRKFHRQIQEGKVIQEQPQRICMFCGSKEGAIDEYLLYKTQVRKDPQKILMHEDCKSQAMNDICRYPTKQ